MIENRARCQALAILLDSVMNVFMGFGFALKRLDLTSTELSETYRYGNYYESII